MENYSHSRVHILTSIDSPKLSGAKNLLGEDLVKQTDVLWRKDGREWRRKRRREGRERRRKKRRERGREGGVEGKIGSWGEGRK